MYAAFGMPPEPRTVPTYDSDGIAIRIPAPSIPDQGTVDRSLTLNELVEILGERLDLSHGGRGREGLKLTLTEISVAAHPIALLVPLLE